MGTRVSLGGTEGLKYSNLGKAENRTRDLAVPSRDLTGNGPPKQNSLSPKHQYLACFENKPKILKILDNLTD